MIQKYLHSAFQLIDRVNKSEHNFNIKVFRTPKHAYCGREMQFKKKENKYCFQATTLVRRGVQTGKELEIKRETEVELTSNGFNLYTQGKNIIPNRISYSDIEEVPPLKIIEGQITALSTRKQSFFNSDRFYRVVFPLSKKVSLFGDFTGWTYSIDGNRVLETLLKLHFSETEFHFFTVNKTKNEHYFVIDSTSKIDLNCFLRAANSILLTYAFLKGDYHGKQAYILTYSHSNFKTPSSLSTMVMAGEVYDGFAIHSTKPFSIVQLQKKIRYKKDSDGRIIGSDTKWANKYMVEFPSECYAKICELIYLNGGVLRAVILYVNNHRTTLELKIPTLFVAIENITKILVGGDTKKPSIIQDEALVSKIKKVIKASIKDINAIKRELKPEGLDSEAEKEYEANFARIASKLHGFNEGSNNKKLSDPFSVLGYTLTEEENNLLKIDRNKFLHGDDYSKMEENYETEFKELFHISLRLQKLIAVLLLKQADYSGYILNNAKIHDYITEKDLLEEVFVKI